MKLPSLALFALALTCGASALLAADAPAPAAKNGTQARISPHETISVHIGGGKGPLVTVTYGRPYSKDPKSTTIRKIWGGLVPWDKAWRLGSDEATLLLIPQAMVIGETTIPAGAYTLYLVPSQNGPTKLAFSSNIGKWGIPVDETHDVARVDVTKSTVDTQVDELTLALAADPAPATTGTLKITWETTQFTLAFALKK
jgi:hypothetical protein